MGADRDDGDVVADSDLDGNENAYAERGTSISHAFARIAQENGRLALSVVCAAGPLCAAYGNAVVSGAVAESFVHVVCTKMSGAGGSLFRKTRKWR